MRCKAPTMSERGVAQKVHWSGKRQRSPRSRSHRLLQTKDDQLPKNNKLSGVLLKKRSILKKKNEEGKDGFRSFKANFRANRV